MRPFRTQAFQALKYQRQQLHEVEDVLTVEAPLHIRINGVAFTTLMRTPGDDQALVRGLLHTEGLLTSLEADPSYRFIPDPETGYPACAEVNVPPEMLDKDPEGRRTELTASSCGLCGTREPRDLVLEGSPMRLQPHEKLDIEMIPRWIAQMEARQDTFQRSGGSHAAAVFNKQAGLLALHEDIGRHNAVDKSIGSLLESGRLGEAQCLLVSGRVSYEFVFKAFRAAIPFILAVSAPSSMTVETAKQFGMTVLGFCRDKRATVYSNPQNVLINGLNLTDAAVTEEVCVG